MNIVVFDIETVPDVVGGRRLLDLQGLSDDDTAKAMFHLRRQEAGTDFLRHHLHRVVAISAVFRSKGEQIAVWTLGDENADEKTILEKFFHLIERYSPTLVSWNGSGFDLPVLHYRAMLHGVASPTYWDQGRETATPNGIII